MEMSSALGIATGTIVDVSVLPALLDADKVWAEPLTIEEWRCLESKAEWLEGGGWLSQVSVVSANQILTLQVDTNTSIRVRILNQTFDANSRGLWPSKTSNMHPCRRLVADTRIVVIPPADDDTNPCRIELEVFRNSHDEYSSCMHELAEQLGVKLVQPSLNTVMIHKTTLEKITSSVQLDHYVTVRSKASSNSCVMRLEQSPHVPLGHVGKFSL